MTEMTSLLDRCKQFIKDYDENLITVTKYQSDDPTRLGTLDILNKIFCLEVSDLVMKYYSIVVINIKRPDFADIPCSGMWNTVYGSFKGGVYETFISDDEYKEPFQHRHIICKNIHRFAVTLSDMRKVVQYVERFVQDEDNYVEYYYNAISNTNLTYITVNQYSYRIYLDN